MSQRSTWYRVGLGLVALAIIMFLVFAAPAAPAAPTPPAAASSGTMGCAISRNGNTLLYNGKRWIMKAVGWEGVAYAWGPNPWSTVWNPKQTTDGDHALQDNAFNNRAAQMDAILAAGGNCIYEHISGDYPRESHNRYGSEASYIKKLDDIANTARDKGLFVFYGMCNDSGQSNNYTIFVANLVKALADHQNVFFGTHNEPPQQGGDFKTLTLWEIQQFQNAGYNGLLVVNWDGNAGWDAGTADAFLAQHPNSVFSVHAYPWSWMPPHPDTYRIIEVRDKYPAIMGEAGPQGNASAWTTMCNDFARLSAGNLNGMAAWIWNLPDGNELTTNADGIHLNDSGNIFKNNFCAPITKQFGDMLYTGGGSSPKGSPGKSGKAAGGAAGQSRVKAGPTVSAVSGVNLALNKPATASAVYPARDSAGNFNRDPKKAVDGDITTAWQPPVGVGSAWLIIDLQATYSVDRFIMVPRDEHPPQAYEIFVSTDSNAWTKVYSTPNEATQDWVVTPRDSGNEIRITPVSVRYIKEAVKGPTGGMMGTEEFQVFAAGSVTKNLAVNKPVTASSGPNASNATDGDIRTGWKPAGAGPHWLIVDLQNEQDVDRINTCLGRRWNEKVPEYSLSLSSDKTNWTKVYTWNHRDAEAVFSSMRARYVRLDMGDSYTVNEIKVYGGASKDMRRSVKK